MQQFRRPQQLQRRLRTVAVPLIDARRIADDAPALQRRDRGERIVVGPGVLAADDDDVRFPALDLFDRDGLQRPMKLRRDVAPTGQGDPVVDQVAAAVGPKRGQRAEVQHARPRGVRNGPEAPAQPRQHPVQIGVIGLDPHQGGGRAQGVGGGVQADPHRRDVGEGEGPGGHAQPGQAFGLGGPRDEGEPDPGGQQGLGVGRLGLDHQGVPQVRRHVVHPRLLRRRVHGDSDPVGRPQHDQRGIVGVPKVGDAARGRGPGRGGGQHEREDRPRPHRVQLHRLGRLENTADARRLSRPATPMFSWI